MRGKDTGNKLIFIMRLYLAKVKRRKKCPEDSRGAKCFHNGIILIVICFQNKYINFFLIAVTGNRKY